MAKDKKPVARTDERTNARTSIALPHEWMCVLQHLCTSRRADMGTIIHGMLERELATMPRAESEAIRTLVRIATGKTLRLSGSSGSANAENESDGAGQGPINRIAEIHLKSVAPIDAALESLG